VFGSAVSGPINLFWKPADGSGAAERLTQSPYDQYPTAVSPDGMRVVFREEGATLDLMTISLTGEHQVAPLVQSKFNELNGEISPDGRWMAYQSDQSGEMEVYVRPFSNERGGIQQISTAGGTRPLWSRNGRELFYLAPSGALMSVAITAGATWSAGRPVHLFEGAYYFPQGGAMGRTYDVSPDGKRFLMIKSADDSPRRIVIVQNWLEELKRLVPTN
jgi:serine/threonine-protein kinase